MGQVFSWCPMIWSTAANTAVRNNTELENDDNKDELEVKEEEEESKKESEKENKEENEKREHQLKSSDLILFPYRKLSNYWEWTRVHSITLEEALRYHEPNLHLVDIVRVIMSFIPQFEGDAQICYFRCVRTDRIMPLLSSHNDNRYPLYKIGVIGDAKVGKSAIIKSLTNGLWSYPEKRSLKYAFVHKKR
ncbi:hypothetical protein RFI_23005, partial [Reticulomyxa filosa]